VGEVVEMDGHKYETRKAFGEPSPCIGCAAYPNGDLNVKLCLDLPKCGPGRTKKFHVIFVEIGGGVEKDE